MVCEGGNRAGLKNCVLVLFCTSMDSTTHRNCMKITCALVFSEGFTGFAQAYRDVHVLLIGVLTDKRIIPICWFCALLHQACFVHLSEFLFYFFPPTTCLHEVVERKVLRSNAVWWNFERKSCKHSSWKLGRLKENVWRNIRKSWGWFQQPLWSHVDYLVFGMVNTSVAVFLCSHYARNGLAAQKHQKRNINST